MKVFVKNNNDFQANKKMEKLNKTNDIGANGATPMERDETNNSDIIIIIIIIKTTVLNFHFISYLLSLG